MKEFSLSINDFKEPKVYSNQEAIMVLLIRLLILEPGTFQSHPDMGVGLVSRFRYGTTDSTDGDGVVSELRSEYERQIAKFMPYIQGVKIEMQMSKEKLLIILAEIDGVLYAIQYDSSANSMKTYISYTDLNS